MIIKDITLEIGGGAPPVVDVSQVDDLWTFRFSFKYNNLPWNASGTPILTGAKPDGHIFAVAGTINAGQALVDATMQMTAVAGLVPCEVRLIQGNRSAAARFILNVAPQPGGQVVIASNSSLTAYAEVLSELGELITAAASIPDDLPGYVADWITENIRSDGTIAVDKTLTVSGAAADAKVTGDQIKALQQAMSQISVETDTDLATAGAPADAKAAGDRIRALEGKPASVPRALSSADMTDTSVIYFYTGGEEGYERYTLYYYNGKEWTPVKSAADADAHLPELRIYGDISVMTAEKNEPKIYTYKWFNLAEKDQRTGYCSMKWQGESSLTYPKKNYTIKFFHDPAYKRKDKLSFFDKLVLKKNKWVVKASWVDRSMAKNIVSCRLWGQIVKSRKTAPLAELQAAPNYGAINGFPIQIYVNDVWHGLYTLNIPKDEDTFNMSEDNPLHCAICGDSQSGTGSTAFRQATTAGWELEVPEDAWPTWTTQEEVDGQTVEVTHRVADGLVALIQFVMNATDEEFKAGLNDRLDVESAIDYYLMCYYDCGIDSLGRNLILLTYNGGEKWYCSLYDADTTWGNGLNGAGTYDAELPCPEMYEMKTSLLWERLEANFGQELYDRWKELRRTVFDAAYIQSQFNMFWADIPEDLFDRDVQRWHGVDQTRPDIPQWNLDVKAKILQFIEDRAVYCDAQIKAMRPPVPCTGITLDQSSIAFTNGTPVTLAATVTPENTTDDIVWSVSDPTVASCEGGVVYPLKNGSATVTVTCGNYSASCAVSVTGLAFAVSLVGANATVTPTTEITPNAAYSGTVAAVAGYELTSVVITMGGTDITSQCYNSATGAISIEHVTGDIVVTVTAQFHYDDTGLEYALPSPFIVDGVSFIDTGFAYSGLGSFTIAMDLTQPDDITTAGQFLAGAARFNDANVFSYDVTYRGFRGVVGGHQTSSGLPAIARDRVKVVMRYNATTQKLSIRATSEYNVAQGRAAESSTSNSHANVTNNQNRDAFTQNLYIGGRHLSTGFESTASSGTIHDFRIYTRRWSDAEVKHYLGVDSLSTVFTDDLDDYAG